MVSDTESGTPQGSPISPLLANIALHVLDEAWAKAAALGMLVRYADDFVVLRHQPEPGRRGPAPDRGGAWSASGCVCIPTRPGSSIIGEGTEGFDFLGFTHRKTPRSRGSLLPVRSGRRPGPWPQSGPRSVIAPTAASPVVSCTALSMTSTPCCGAGGRTSATATRRGSSPPSTATSTNGWPSWPASSTAPEAGTWASRFNYAWLDRPRRLPADRERCATGDCACLTMNGVGEPCAGEPHARFDRGPLGRLTPRRDGTHAPTRETGGTEPIRRTGHTEPAAYLTTFWQSGCYPRSAHLDRALNGPYVASLVTASCTWPRGRANDSTTNSDVLALMHHDPARRIEQHSRMDSDSVPCGP